MIFNEAGDIIGKSSVRIISYCIMIICALIAILLFYSIASDTPIRNIILGNQTNNTGTTGGTSGGTTGTGTGSSTGSSGGTTGGIGGTTGTGGTAGNPPNNTNQTTPQNYSSQCNDLIDNDLDGASDMNDFSCIYGLSINEIVNLNESSYMSQCQDGIDNDNDTLIDFPADSGCTSLQDNSEGSNPRWEKLNGGLRLSDGDLVSYFNNPGSDVVMHKEINGNLIYFYTDGDSKFGYVGRLNVQNKAWQSLTFSGWSSQGISRPFSDNNLYSPRIRVFNHPQLGIIGSVGASARVGNLFLDEHGGAYSFRFNNGEVDYWNSNGWSKYKAQVLGYSYRGASGNGHDSNFNSNYGIVVGDAGDWNNHGLTASRYSFSTNKWENWNNGWTENLNSYSLLPYYEQGTTLNIPVVSNIEGTNDFILTFIQDVSNSMTIRALRYNSASQSWMGWNNNAWTSAGATSAVYSGQIVYSYRPSFTRGNFVTSFFLDNDKLVMLRYNSNSQTWSNEIVANNVINFESAENGDEIWVVYKSGSKIYKKVLFNGIFTEASVIFENASNAVLSGFGFVQGEPVLFYIEDSGGKGKLFVLGDKSEGYWNNEVSRQADNVVSGQVLSSNVGQYLSEFDTQVLIEMPNPSQPSQTIVSQSYGNFECGNLGLDNSSRLYCPHVIMGSVAIFPRDYVPNLVPDSGRMWGSFFEYFIFPTGVAVDESRGKVYISDYINPGGGGGLGTDGRLQIWDYSKVGEHVVYRFGTSPANWFDPPAYPVYSPNIALTNLAWPGDVEIDSSRGVLYIVENRANRIRKYNLNSQGGIVGTYSAIGEEGTGNGQLRLPQSIALDSNGNLYVSDSLNHRIQKFNPQGGFLTKWGSFGRGNGEFIYPQFIALDKIKRYVYVSDILNKKIQIFNSDGEYISSFSSWSGGTMGEVGKFGGMAANNNNLWISVINESGNRAVVKFQMNLP